jgi:glycosyltransferase involved in cell wall biosynthesis
MFKKFLKSVTPPLIWNLAKKIRHLIWNLPRRMLVLLGKIRHFIKQLIWRFSIIKKNGDIAVIDSGFPDKSLFGFRNYEISGLMKLLENCESYTLYPTMPGVHAWFNRIGMTRDEFKKNKKEYIKYYPENAKKLHYLSEITRYNFKLAYSIFLSNTYTLLPFYIRNKIPFVFVLYPGGTFGLNNPNSDNMLNDIFSCEYFKGVIVTQKVTYDYIIDKMKVDKSKIFYLFGGYNQFEVSQALTKKKYKTDKATFDICFVAAKYSEKGIDKGYDLFVDSAKYLYKKYQDIRFHVVGGFNDKDIDIEDIKDRFIFYGYRKPDFLIEFYSEMDICLAPCRPFKLYQGNFDGFPLGFECAVCATALFTTDELNNNRGQISEDCLVIIKPDLDDIVNKIEYYYNNLDKLYELSYKGQLLVKENVSLKRLECVKNILYACSNISS